MKFVELSRFNDPDTAARKLVEIANAAEAVQDGRIYIERVANAGSVPRRAGSRDHLGLAVAARTRNLCEIHARRRRVVRLNRLIGFIPLIVNQSLTPG
jgi:hypothetical protein